MTYNMSAVESANNIGELFLGVNTATTDNYVSMAGLLLITIFIVLFIIMLRYQPAPESFLASSALSTIISLILLAMGAVSAVWAIGFGSMLAFSAVAIYLKR